MTSRRTFLAQLGLAAAAMPFAGHALRTLADPGDPPMRLVLWPMMNGADHAHFWPSGGAGTSLVTEPLAPFASRTTFVRGLNIAGSDNHFAVRAIFTGQPVPSYDSADPAVHSLDQVVARALDADLPRPVRSLHLGARPADSYEFYQLYGRSTLFFTPEGPVDYEASPVAAFDRLFGSLGGGTGTPPPPTSSIDVRAEALALAHADFASLSSRVATLPSEREKIEQHLASLERLRPDPTTMPTPMPVTCDASPIPSVESLRGALGTARDAYRDEHFAPIFDAHVDITARALVCGLTQVATLQAGSADGNVAVPVDGGSYPHHNTSHGDQTVFARVQRFYMQRLARLLTALDVPDPLDIGSGRTVLDNTCVVVMAECLPSSHASTEVPCMLIGGLAGRMRTGTTVNVGGATNRHLLKSVARAFGVPDADTSHFGSDEIREVRT